MEMKKKREKAARRLMALLAAVCMLGTMPGMPAVSYAEESAGEVLEMYDAAAGVQGKALETAGSKGEPAVLELEGAGTKEKAPDGGKTGETANEVCK